MQISFEVPFQLLEESKRFNDFEFGLVHLLEIYPIYKEFLRNCVKEGRLVILDNSAYELNGSADINILIKGYYDINPTYIVAPDYLDDMYRTVEATKEFIDRLNPPKNKVIPVIQGRTYEEYITSYNTYLSWNMFEYIAIPFMINGFEYLDIYKTQPTQALKWAYSRNILIEKLHKDNIIDVTKKHHLLGCGDPLEFQFYKLSNYNFLTSLDTSCPIILSIFNETLNPLIGLGKEKRKERLVDNLNYKFTNFDLLYNNIEIFKRYCI